MTPRVLTRPLEESDHAQVLALNAAHVELLSPLDDARLTELAAAADQALVIELDGAFAGFVLTFTAGAAYDGDHFAWFSARHDDFAYLDRIVLDPRTRRRGVATVVYDALEQGCRRPVMCLEVNVDPPNEPSLAFHAGRGYTEVGRTGPDGHRVAMLVKRLATT